jgi:hypothetical protein
VPFSVFCSWTYVVDADGTTCNDRRDLPLTASKALKHNRSNLHGRNSCYCLLLRLLLLCRYEAGIGKGTQLSYILVLDPWIS